jgi:hypothetical protein
VLSVLYLVCSVVYIQRALLLLVYEKFVENMVWVFSHRQDESDTFHGTNQQALLQVSLLALFK